MLSHAQVPTEITVPVAARCHHASPQPPYGLLSTLVSLRATDCTVLLLQATAWALRALQGGQHSTPYLTKGVPTPPWGMAPRSAEAPELQLQASCTLGIPEGLMPPCSKAMCTA